MSRKIFKLAYLLAAILVISLMVLLYFNSYSSVEEPFIAHSNTENHEPNNLEIDNSGETHIINLEIDISEHFITNVGDPGNLYYIDENLVLWGSGKNDFGQLGQGKRDNDFHNIMQKIAENVVHVDYSQRGVVIYLTSDNKLYGFGNAGNGIIAPIDSFSHEFYLSYGNELNSISKPVLLMENVSYARLGRSDITVIKEDSSVLIWGVIWYANEGNYYYQKHPIKVLDDAVLITGGFYNHAALLSDGTVWTWGYNYSGNCGVPIEEPLISIPREVANNVIMVWTGNLVNNINVFDINEIESYPIGMENTIIQKADGSYWICGMNVGDEEKIIPVYYEAIDYPAIFTDEFHPYID
ncbi:MAG: hypothetical protein FWG91_13210 [Lachnospiraceae bacterium]|nr:hypothetical protein [Lachnospiraceae bacterium]